LIGIAARMVVRHRLGGGKAGCMLIGIAARMVVRKRRAGGKTRSINKILKSNIEILNNIEFLKTNDQNIFFYTSFVRNGFYNCSILILNLFMI
jgi:hypothetical protein